VTIPTLGIKVPNYALGRWSGISYSNELE